MKTQMRIVELRSENFKRLRAVRIRPAGCVVEVCGRNAQGKSSVLDSIEAALGGARALPARPVHSGADEARIILDLGELTVTRKCSADGKSTLVVESKDAGKITRPQDLLDRLAAKIGFDPLAFSRMEPKAQSETLRKLVGLDFTALDRKRQLAFDRRTGVNRDHAAEKARLDAMDPAAGAPAEEEPIASLAAELSKGSAAQRQKTAAETNAANLRRSIGELEQQIFDLNVKLEEAREELKATEEEAASVTVPDTSEVEKRLSEANATNAKVRARKAYLEKREEVAKHKASSDELTAQIEAVDAEKRAALEAARFPVAGLSFDESGVTFNGLPLQQASSAEKIKVGLAVSRAMNPELPLCLIRDGSLLDDESMQTVADFAESYGMQVWVERVDSSGKTGIVIEDGEVVKENAAVK
jgi:hypothetical protein